MLPLNISICEDDPFDATVLRGLIAKSGVSASVFVYNNTAEFLSAFQPGLFQLAFLDIYFKSDDEKGKPDAPDAAETGNPDGLDAAVKIREADPDVWIVFTTYSLGHARFGYKVKAERYLDKPLEEQEVISLLERAAGHFSEASAEIVVTVDYKKRCIKQRDIRYVEIFNKKSVIHLEDEAVTVYVRIGEMEEQLSLPSFVRCHRGFIVNMEYIEAETEDGRDFIMQNGDKVYIGQNIRRKVRKTYREYVARLARGEMA